MAPDCRIALDEKNSASQKQILYDLFSVQTVSIVFYVLTISIGLIITSINSPQHKYRQASTSRRWPSARPYRCGFGFNPQGILACRSKFRQILIELLNNPSEYRKCDVNHTYCVGYCRLLLWRSSHSHLEPRLLPVSSVFLQHCAIRLPISKSMGVISKSKLVLYRLPGLVSLSISYGIWELNSLNIESYFGILPHVRGFTPFS